MIKISNVKLSPLDTDYKKAVAKALKTKEDNILNIEILRKGDQLRQSNVCDPPFFTIFGRKRINVNIKFN